MANKKHSINSKRIEANILDEQVKKISISGQGSSALNLSSSVSVRIHLQTSSLELPKEIKKVDT